MIYYTRGNLLDAKVDALVNTVNCVGIMGKGIALAFKNIFPDNMRAYATACLKNQVKVGSMFVFKTSNVLYPRIIINFPTKEHWRNPSQIEWIQQGLVDLKKTIIEEKITSIAIPALGCANGGLHWADVKPMIEKELSGLDCVIDVYEPLR